MANLQCSPGAATFIHNEQALLQGSGDNIPATSVLMIAVSTAPGGPYTFQVSSPLAVGDNTVGQSVNNIFCGLTPNTQYYFRTEERDQATASTIIDASSECTFTTSDAADDYFNNGPGITVQASAILTRNDIVWATEFNDLPLDASCGIAFNEIRFEHSTSALGPWTLTNDLYRGGVLEPNPAQLFLASNPFNLVYPFDANTTYFIRATLIRDGIDYSEVITEADGPTFDYPVFECNQNDLNEGTTSTSANVQMNSSASNSIVNASDISDPTVPLNNDSFTMRWGTTPGGPYPNTIGPLDADSLGLTPLFSIGGLAPSTQYCYVIDQFEDFQTGGLYDTTDECCFFTLSDPNDWCGNSNVAATTATISGAVDHVPVFSRIRNGYSTTPGGPYTFPAANGTPGTGTATTGQVVNDNISGLTPNTTYYHVTQVTNFDEDEVFETSSECQFTTLNNAAVTADPATNITSTTADLNGTVDNIPTDGFVRICYGTTPGGPYNICGPSDPGTNTPGQSLTDPVAGLTPSTTYYYVVEQLDTDGTTVLQTSNEEQFETLAPPIADFGVECGTLVAPAGNRNRINSEVTYDINDIPPWPVGGPSGWYFLVDYSTAGPAGPWSPAPIVDGFASVCAGNEPDNKIFVSASSSLAHIADTVPTILPNTQYHVRWQLYDDNDNLRDEQVCGPVTTRDFPTFACTAATERTETSFKATLGALSGSVATDDPCWNDTIIWEIATVPGGPYTPEPVEDVTTLSPTHTFTGLTQGTTYYYRARLSDPQGSEYLVTQECSASTLVAPPLVDPCTPATNVTQISATLNAVSQNVPAGYSYRFRYGTTPGGPYTNIVSGGPSSGGSPDPYSANIVGLSPNTTYYYTSEVLDPGMQVVADGGECSFTTTDGVYYCGALYDPNNCVFVDPGNGAPYHYCIQF